MARRKITRARKMQIGIVRQGDAVAARHSSMYFSLEVKLGKKLSPAETQALASELRVAAQRFITTKNDPRRRMTTRRLCPKCGRAHVKGCGLSALGRRCRG